MEICRKLKLNEPSYETTSLDVLQVGEENRFSCKCVLSDLKCFSVGVGKSKKVAKSESAKKTIEVIAHIPDVQQVIFSLMMASNLQDSCSFPN